MNESETSGAELRCRSPSLSQDHLFSRQGLPPGKLIPHIIIGYRPLTIYDLNYATITMKLSDTNYFKKQDSLKSQNKNAEFSLLNQLKRKNFSKYTLFSLLYFFIYYLISKYYRAFVGKDLLKMSLNTYGIGARDSNPGCAATISFGD